MPQLEGMGARRRWRWPPLREVYTNTVEGTWTSVRTFLRPFRGVHKRYLSGDVALCEFSIDLTRVTPEFISAWVAQHLYST